MQETKIKLVKMPHYIGAVEILELLLTKTFGFIKRHSSIALIVPVKDKREALTLAKAITEWHEWHKSKTD